MTPVIVHWRCTLHGWALPASSPVVAMVVVVVVVVVH